jgi:hypothetical protein
METETTKLCAVWNPDDEMWVILKNGPEGMTTAPTILELSQKLNDSEHIFPMKVRYPGKVETVNSIH